MSFCEPEDPAEDAKLEEQKKESTNKTARLFNNNEFKEHLARLADVAPKGVMALVGKTTDYLRQVAPELARVHKQCRDAF